ncbi:MAG: hypothetical protein JST39_17365 [Bacteroidetes bacterium]|nr:hypothetical protein [Bacteroidota bacterium]
MKSFFVLAALFTATASLAQTKTIYGKFTKSDGARIKGTSVMRGYEDQLIITSYTGGSDNTATIEIEVPTGAYVADFRNMMNAAQPAPAIAAIKPASAAAVSPAGATIANAPPKTMAVRTVPAPQLARVDISVTNRVSNNVPTLTNQIILEDIKVLNCADDAASGTTRIKLKATRIGWVYYSVDPKTGKNSTTNKSGWDTITGASWTNFQ